MYSPKAVVIAAICLAGFVASPVAAQNQSKPAGEVRAAAKKPHRVVIQITQNDPAVMNVALNNAENLAKYYQDRGEKAEIEFVAYGPGLNMLRSDTSPVRERLATIGANMKNVTFSGCGNTLANQSKMENKDLTLIPEGRIVPSGIARVVELEEQGWTYVRP